MIDSCSDILSALLLSNYGKDILMLANNLLEQSERLVLMIAMDMISDKDFKFIYKSAALPKDHNDRL